MVWTVIVSDKARKDFKKIKRHPDDPRIRAALFGLRDNPRPPGATKLTGHDDLWRIRVGDWRIVYAIEDDKLIILIVAIGQRGGIYEKLSR